VYTACLRAAFSLLPFSTTASHGTGLSLQHPHLGTQLECMRLRLHPFAGQAVMHEGEDIWIKVSEDEAIRPTCCSCWLLLLLLAR